LTPSGALGASGASRLPARASASEVLQMTAEHLQAVINLNPAVMPWVLGAAVVVLSVAVFLIARYFIARGLVSLSTRTKNKYDDVIVEKLRPFRFAWVAPLLVIYYLAGLLPESTAFIRQAVLLLILWLVVLTFNSLLTGFNAIYEASDRFRGVSIQSYLDLAELAAIVGALIVTASVFTGQSPVVLLSGLGVVMALLVLMFRDTMLSFVASVQINSSDLVREGDWIEMPSYDADGSVMNISLHTVQVQNWDNTTTVIPTHKLLEEPFKNWRSMSESGGRRIKRALYIDLNSIRFCDQEMLERFRKVALVREVIEARLLEVDETGTLAEDTKTRQSMAQLTNMDAFQAYVANYLKLRPDIHQDGMTLLVRQLDPGPTGLPLEIYAFTRTVEWEAYEAIQADIFNHLLGALPQFDLRVFQQPTRADFQSLVMQP
jgi:miniconductance mechanosensitive channel